MRSESYERDPRRDLAYSRTHLANQRTYAAWLRTEPSVAVDGIAVAPGAGGADRAFGAAAFGMALAAIGIAVILFGAWSFRRVWGGLSPVPARRFPR